jgi:hypothetical protein
MYTTIRHELRHARKAWPGTPVGPCLLSGTARSCSAASFIHVQLLLLLVQPTVTLEITNLKGQCHGIFPSNFFHKSSSPKPLKITQGSFRIVDTGGKFAALVSLIPLVHLDLQISPRVFEKIRNGPNHIIRGLGKLIHVEKLKSKISWHCPF